MSFIGYVQNPGSCLLPFSTSQTSFSALSPDSNTQTNYTLLFQRLALLGSLSTPFPILRYHIAPQAPSFLFPRENGQIVACWGGDSFPLVLICALQPSQGNGMPLFDETGAPRKQLLHSVKLVLKTVVEQEGQLSGVLGMLLHPAGSWCRASSPGCALCSASGAPAKPRA